MTYLHALILGIVEGITEFLPISSTGHLILTARLLGLSATSFVKTFEIAIQLGAIFAVVVLYWRKLLLSLPSLKRLIVAFIPTAVFGLVAYPYIKKFLLGNTSIVLWSLFIGGVVIIFCEKYFAKKLARSEQAAHAAAAAHDGKNSAAHAHSYHTTIETIPFKKAFWVGVFQTFAFIPGVSRAAATIIGGMFLGISRTTIVEFSFLLAVPTMAAATGLDLLKSAGEFSSADFGVLGIGLGTSFIVALFAIKFLIKFVQKNTFIGFGLYRMAVAICMALYLQA